MERLGRNGRPADVLAGRFRRLVVPTDEVLDSVPNQVWSGTPIRDTSCCCHPLNGVPYLRPGPRTAGPRPRWRQQSRLGCRGRSSKQKGTGRTAAGLQVPPPLRPLPASAVRLCLCSLCLCLRRTVLYRRRRRRGCRSRSRSSCLRRPSSTSSISRRCPPQGCCCCCCVQSLVPPTQLLVLPCTCN